MQPVVSAELFQVREVVADLHALGPVAELLPQQQVVQRVRADAVEELPAPLSQRGGPHTETTDSQALDTDVTVTGMHENHSAYQTSPPLVIS